MDNSLENWMIAVEVHNKQLCDLSEKRASLKEDIEEYLRKFFSFDKIEFSKDFTKITLTWNRSSPVIKHEVFKDFEMDWIVDSRLSVTRIEVYPWGVKDGYYPSI